MKTAAYHEQQLQKMKSHPGCIAALDQSGGSTPAALHDYGIKQANAVGIGTIVSQQFEVAGQIIAAGFVPIIEPEVDIRCPEKAKAEELLRAAILEKLSKLPAAQLVMLKLTLPEQDDFYADC